MAIVLALLSPAIQAADLTVRVSGVSMDDASDAHGRIKLMLFDRAEGFRKEDKARQVLALPAKPGTVSGVFRDLPPGRYALIAYHDGNGNGKLDLRLGMFPNEGYGLSNNLKPLGPPAFAEASFDLPAAGAVVDLRLEY
jgi:uncharacterized protein (DUF2141 family)